MATSTIPNPERITTLQMAINTSSASGNGTVTVCGRIATLTASIHNNVTGTNLLLASFNASYAPRINTRIYVGAYASDGLAAECTVTTEGTLIFAIPSGYSHDMKLCGSWVTKG